MAKNKSMCELPVKRNKYKNETVIVHSFAFGGRGVYFLTKRSFSHSSRTIQGDHSATEKTCGRFLVFDPGILAISFGLLMAMVLAVLFSQMAFDASLGFPGEGPEGPESNWSSQRLTMATWNTRSMTKERFDYCHRLQYDVLAVTELWNKTPSFAKGTIKWTYGIPALDPETKEPVYPKDPAAGTGILLSDRAAAKYMSHGSPCNRISWVRLKGSATNMFIIAVYLPHRARIKPAQSDTIQSLVKLLRQVPKHDCIILMGDFNEQLPGKVTSCTGKWCVGEASANADDILSVMRMFNLFAVNTAFQPAGRKTNATYLACVEGADNSRRYKGREVRVKYKGEPIDGVVVGSSFKRGPHGSKQLWHLRFADGYNMSCREGQLRKWLKPVRKKYIGK